MNSHRLRNFDKVVYCSRYTAHEITDWNFVYTHVVNIDVQNSLPGVNNDNNYTVIN